MKPRTYQFVNGPEHGKTIRLEREAYLLRFQFGDYKIVRVGSRLFYLYVAQRFAVVALILLVSRAILEAL